MNLPTNNIAKLMNIISIFIFKKYYNKNIFFLTYSSIDKYNSKFTVFQISGGFLLNSSENIDISVNRYSSWTHCRISWIRSTGNISPFHCFEKLWLFTCIIHLYQFMLSYLLVILFLVVHDRQLC